ncbi:MAG: alpha/beta hydrolase [Bacillota bacterium]|nr:alpha/beta hydrolase [Bacillota bacterium]
MEIKREVVRFPSRDGRNRVFSEVFYPSGEIKGIVQFAHGMSDYGGRYSHFFEYLAANGYIAAYNDHLGHGKTVSSQKDLGFFSEKDGYKKLVEDFDKFYDILDNKFPDLPHFVIGHSMGSFIVRCFLAGNKGDGAVLMGTGNKNPLAGLGVGLSGLLKVVQGKRRPSKFLTWLSFGTYNKRINDSQHQWAWLSTVPQAQQDILDDQLRNKLFTTSAFQDLFYLAKYANSDEIISKTPKEMPLLFISGADDPLGSYGRGIVKLGASLEQRGFTQVETKIMENARHELCHERPEIRQEVFSYIVRWLDSVLEKSPKALAEPDAEPQE